MTKLCQYSELHVQNILIKGKSKQKPTRDNQSAPIKHSSSVFSTPLFESVPYFPNDYVCPLPPSKSPRIAWPLLLSGKGQI